MEERVLTEIGALRADVKSLMRSFERFNERFEAHMSSDDKQFGAIREQNAAASAVDRDREKRHHGRRWITEILTNGLSGSIAGALVALSMGHK